MDGDASSQEQTGEQLANILAAGGNDAGTGLANGLNTSLDASGLGYTAGQNATQGALDTLTPYLPYIIVGLIAVALIA